jgi:hypothetical protein
MINFNRKLKYHKWYDTEGGFKILIDNEDIVYIKYGPSEIKLDLQLLIVNDIILSKLFSNFDSMPTIGRDIELEDLSLKDLNILLEEMLKVEDYKACEKIKKIIDEKEKNNKKS